MSRQTKLRSLIETTTGTLVGMVLAFLISQLASHYELEIQMYIYTNFEWKISPKSNLIMTFIFTSISLARAYIWRRMFNRRV